MAGPCKFPQNPETLAAAKGGSYSIDSQGRYRLVSKGERAHLGTFDTVEELRAFLSAYEPPKMPDLDGSLVAPFDGIVTNHAPSVIQDQVPLSKGRALFSSLQTGALKIITPIKQMTQAMERLGIGKPFTNIYEPLEASLRRVSVRLFTPREALGESYDAAVHKLNRLAVDLNPEQRRLSVLLDEISLTKDDIARPGVLTEGGMSPGDINLANFFSREGVAEEIPKLIRMNVIMDQFLQSREGVLTTLIPRIEGLVSIGKLPQEFLGFAEQLRSVAGDVKDFEGLIKTLNLSEKEIGALQAIRGSLNDETSNTLAVYRHAIAPELQAGFKNGREQAIALRKIEPKTVATADYRRKILEEAFNESGLSREQILGAQLPVFRQMADVGIFPFGQNDNIPKYIKDLFDGIPEGKEVLTRRVLSGHINPHELDPTVTAYKHIRNLALREEFDPLTRRAYDEIASIERLHPEKRGLVNSLTDHVHNLEGRDPESYRQLNESIRFVASKLGYHIDDKFAAHLVSTLSRLSSQASIPFRAALVVRNYFQTLLLTAPVIGIEDWGHGLKIASGWADGKFNLEVLEAARNRAIKAGALEPNVVPVFEPAELFGAGQSRIFAGAGPKLQKASLTIEEAFDWGFNVYRKADDWGRTVAFEGGRHRVNRFAAVWQKSNKSTEALEQFKRSAKVKTFDETIEAQFEALVRADRLDDAANLIGKELADKTHFLYGHSNHPSGWNGVAGRLLGQFGTFPVQYAQYVAESLGRGTLKDRASWAVTHSAINAGIIVAGAEVFGADLTSWATLPSLRYSGGPYADMFLSLAGVWGGSDAERNLAMNNLKMMFPTLTHPQSIFVPGSYFAADIKDALMSDDLLSGAAQLSGLRMLKPGEQNSVQKAFPWAF